MIIPYEQYRWIAQSLPYPNQREEQSFYDMCSNLAWAKVSTVLWFAERRIYVFTWTPQRMA